MMLPFARHRSVRGRRRPGWVPIEQLDGSYVALSCVTSVEYKPLQPQAPRIAIPTAMLSHFLLVIVSKQEYGAPITGSDPLGVGG